MSSFGLILGAVGAVAGSFVPGVGTALGWAVGSTIGNAIDVSNTVIRREGPKLSDLSIQVSTYGGMVPMHFGTVGVVGIPMWLDRITPHSKETSESGKGGPTTVTTTTTYTTSVAILLGEGVCLGIRKITLDGKLWYSVADDADVSTIVASSMNSGQFKFYAGNETQLPDPTMEAVLGVGNVPAYRGEAYVVFTDNADILNGNSLRQLKFELVYAGSTAVQNKKWQKGPAVSDGGNWPMPFVNANSDEIIFMEQTDSLGAVLYKIWSLTPTSQTLLGSFYPFDQAFGYQAPSGSSDTAGHLIPWITVASGNMAAYRWITPDGALPTTYYVGATSFVSTGSGLVRIFSKRGNYMAIAGLIGGAFKGVRLHNTAGEFIAARDFTGTFSGTETLQGVILTGSFLWVASWDTAASANTFYKCSLVDLSTIASVSFPTSSAMPGSATHWTQLFGNTQISLGSDDSTYLRVIDTSANLYILMLDESGVMTMVSLDVELKADLAAGQEAIQGSAFGYNPSSGLLTFLCWHNAADQHVWPYSVNLNALTAGPTTVGAAISAICQRAGYTPAQLDVTQLTDPLLGYSIANVAPARAAIEPLLKLSYSDPVDSDGKTKFVKRGGSIVATIYYDDLCGHEFGQEMGDPFAFARTQEVDLPRSLVVNFKNPLADYETGSERSPQRSTTSQNDIVDDVPIVMLPQKAAEMASVLYFDQIIQRQPRSFAVLKGKFDHLEPTDPVYVEWPHGTFNPVRLVKRDENGPVLKFECVPEDADAYTPNAVAASSTIGQSSITLAQPTALMPWDIPILQDTDDNAGLYMAMAQGSAGNGAVLYRSPDDVDYRDVGTVENSAVIGYAASTLGNWTGGNVFDEVNFVDILLNDQSAVLNSATQTAVLADKTLNAFAIGTHDVELAQFKTATLLSAGTYRLSGLLRGRLRTEWAMGLHTSADRFAMLGIAGMLRPDEGASAIGALRYYRPVSIGRSLASSYTTSFTNTAVGLMPGSPVNIRWGVNAAGDYLIYAQRRSRMQNRQGFLWDLPLGETAESYDMEVYSDAGYTTLKHTFPPQATLSFTYTIAQQVADFGSAPTALYLTLYQRSSVVGRGYAASYAISNVPFQGSWSPDTAFQGFVLAFTNANATVQRSWTGGGSFNGTVRGGQSANSGKKRFQFYIDAHIASNSMTLGICSGNATMQVDMTAANAAGSKVMALRIDGPVYNDGVYSGVSVNPSPTTGDVLDWYIDFTAGKAWIYRNGVSYQGDAVAGTSPLYTFTAGTAMFPFANFIWSQNLQSVTLRLSAPSQALTPLTGYSAPI